MKTVYRALAVALSVSLGASAAEGKGSASHGGGHSDSGLVFLDLFLDLVTLGVEVAAFDAAVQSAPPPPEGYRQRLADDDAPPGWRAPSRRFQAREGLLLSFGLGGGSLYASSEAPGRTGAFDLDFRLGYGFSDRFQFFMDAALDAASYGNGYYGANNVASWTFTFRGQTVLIGDRAGNGLNVNFGIGLGGLTRNSGYIDQVSSPTGLALAGGLSYDARVSPWFALSPEFFYTWHKVPAAFGGAGHDVATIYGLRLNFLWYLH